MLKFLSKIIIVASTLGYLTAVSLGQANAQTTPNDKVKKQVNHKSESRVIVVGPSKIDESDETYGDWAEYFNEFVSGHPEIKIVKIEMNQLGQHLLRTPKMSNKYCTIFINSKGKIAYY